MEFPVKVYTSRGTTPYQVYTCLLHLCSYLRTPLLVQFHGHQSRRPFLVDCGVIALPEEIGTPLPAYHRLAGLSSLQVHS